LFQLFPLRKAGIFCPGQEIKELREGLDSRRTILPAKLDRQGEKAPFPGGN
jgi:hypothetical protein